MSALQALRSKFGFFHPQAANDETLQVRPTLGRLRSFPYQNDTLCQHFRDPTHLTPPQTGIGGFKDSAATYCTKTGLNIQRTFARYFWKWLRHGNKIACNVTSTNGV